MPQGKAWDNFFNNIDNKTDLVKLALEFFKSLEGRSLLKIPLIFTCQTACYRLTKDDVNTLPYMNHEEADSKIICRVCATDTPVLVVSKDTDVFILLVYAMHTTTPKFDWILQTDKQEFINIKEVLQYIGHDVANVFLQFHAITGCDTSSFKYRRGKRATMKKLLQDTSICKYLQKLGSGEYII